MLAPFRAVAPHPALLLWLAANALALVGGVILTARGVGLPLSSVAWHAAIFFPAFATFLNRQDVPIVFLLAAGGYALRARERSFAAGVMLALASIKFHLLLLVPLAFLLKKNWRAVQGLLAGTGLLAGICVLMVRPDQLLHYLSTLLWRSAPNMDPHPERITNLYNLARGSWKLP